MARRLSKDTFQLCRCEKCDGVHFAPRSVWGSETAADRPGRGRRECHQPAARAEARRLPAGKNADNRPDRLRMPAEHVYRKREFVAGSEPLSVQMGSAKNERAWRLGKSTRFEDL